MYRWLPSEHYLVVYQFKFNMNGFLLFILDVFIICILSLLHEYLCILFLTCTWVSLLKLVQFLYFLSMQASSLLLFWSLSSLFFLLFAIIFHLFSIFLCSRRVFLSATSCQFMKRLRKNGARIAWKATHTASIISLLWFLYRAREKNWFFFQVNFAKKKSTELRCVRALCKGCIGPFYAILRNRNDQVNHKKSFF